MLEDVSHLSWDFEPLSGLKACITRTVIYWLKQVGELLPDAYEPEAPPQVGELDELETFVGSKKPKSGARSAVDHFKAGILGWVLGDHSAATFKPLWAIVKRWQCYFVCHRWVVSLSGFYPRW